MSIRFLDFDAYLKLNDITYSRLISRVERGLKENNNSKSLVKISMAAGFAAAFHTGRFFDGRIENLLVEIGEQIDSQKNLQRRRPSHLTKYHPRRHVLHVASHVTEIAGHTRMLHHWAKHDVDSTHTVVVTSQGEREIPTWLHQSIQNRGGTVIRLPDKMSPVEKASAVRQIAQTSATLVVLHHDGHDVVPVLAFSCTHCPPVAVLNHADHQFWLGPSVADVCINLRSAAIAHCMSRRSIHRNVVLPIPLDNQNSVFVTKSQARCALGIPSDVIVILSIGREEKYYPRNSYDFTRTACKILDRLPNAHVYVVGPIRDNMVRRSKHAMRDRLHFVGPQPDPYLYRIAADLYIESFPFGSQTALLEAALVGLPIVPAYKPLFPLLVANDDDLVNLLPNPLDEQEYISRIVTFAENADLRSTFGGILKEQLIATHGGQGWLDRLLIVYENIESISHTYRRLPETLATTGQSDVALSLWRVAADGRCSSAQAFPVSRTACLGHAAYISRMSGESFYAVLYSLRLLLFKPLKTSSWRLLLVSLLGKFSREAREQIKRASGRWRKFRPYL